MNFIASSTPVLELTPRGGHQVAGFSVSGFFISLLILIVLVAIVVWVWRKKMHRPTVNSAEESKSSDNSPSKS